ncbi:MAG TPA: DNA polymerase, partial [Nitrososphaeraceae archaeon]|nr:DNA polymerase [Nitrososphaeraceae archaeon]
KGSTLHFEKYRMTMPVDYLCFADFEVMLVPVSDTTNQNTKITHKHVPIAFSYYIVGPGNTPFSNVESYVGPDAASVFLDRITKHALAIEQLYKAYPEAQLSKKELRTFRKTKVCCICSKPLVFDPENRKVRHHSHVTGEFIGAAHNECNLKCRVPNFLPIFFHNLSKYDGHFITLVCDNTVKDINTIPLTEETYISFSKKISQKFFLRFVDSYRFLQTSLRSLADNLPASDFIHTRTQFPDDTEFDFARKKNFFPYEYLDCEEKLTLRALPPRSKFYSSLDDTNITEEEYEFAKSAWNAFKCKTLHDYLEKYCIIDVLLLADCYLSFRGECMEAYGLDPTYCYSLPGYSFEAFLKQSEVELEQLSDPDMYLFFESSIHGGITSTVKRYSKANNKNVPNYNPNEPPNSLLYIDANNLYGYAMSQHLPLEDFEFVRDLSIFTDDFISKIPPDGTTGYFLEVDLKYPESLHDRHNSLPLCPEKKKPANGSVEKLLCTLEDKYNYVLHYRTLQFCLSQGMILTKVHRAVSFIQAAFLTSYIQKNTEFRQHSTNDFKKSLYKLMNNACFGKFIENQRGRISFDLCCNETRIDKLIRSPFFKRSVIFKESLVGVHRYKQKQLLNRPIYVGAAILELARLHMYQFCYEVLPTIFHDVEYELNYLDTDSFILSVKTLDLTPYIQQHSEYFDLSDYSHDHPLYCRDNAKVPGKFKNELPNCHMSEYLSLCPKVYAIETYPKHKEIKKVKGCKKNVIKKELNFNAFKNCLFNHNAVRKTQQTFRSNKHRINTISQTKTVLELLDNKRVWLPDNIHSLAYGHKDIPNASSSPPPPSPNTI